MAFLGRTQDLDRNDDRKEPCEASGVAGCRKAGFEGGRSACGGKIIARSGHSANDPIADFSAAQYIAIYEP